MLNGSQYLDLSTPFAQIQSHTDTWPSQTALSLNQGG